MNEVKEQLKSVQSENHVISHLLNYPKSYLGIKGPITTKDFTSYNNRKIFEAIGAIFESRNEVTELSVCQKLKDSGVSFNGGVDDYVEALYLSDVKSHAFKQALRILSEKTLRRNLYSDSESLIQSLLTSETLDLKPSELASHCRGQIESTISNWVDEENEPTHLTRDAEDLLNEKYNAPEETKIIKAPYPTLQKCNGGFRPGSVTCFVAGSGVGKTAFLGSMGLEIAKTGIPVLYLNTEMTDDEMLSRYASQVLNINANDFDDMNIIRKNVQKNRYYLDNKHKLEENKGVPFFHIMVEGKSTDEITSICLNWHHKNVGTGNKCVVIYDYLKITGEKITQSNQEHQVLRDKVFKLKESIANRLNAPLLTALQTNREGNREPRSIKEATFIDDGALAGSFAVKNGVSQLWFLERKHQLEIDLDNQGVSHEELMDNPRPYGVFKMLTTKLRQCTADGARFQHNRITRTTPDGDIQHRHQINLGFENFTFTDLGETQDIVDELNGVSHNNSANEEHEDHDAI